MADFELEVTEEDAGQRIDVVLARRVPGLSRGRAKELVERGKARVDDRAVRKSHALSLGERVVVDELPPPTDFHAAPDPELPLRVLRETDDYVIVDKAAGVPSHPLQEGELGTLAGALVARYPEMRDIGYNQREPGIVHRLDTGTSGVVLAARNERAFEALRAQMKAGQIEKRYLARVVGFVEAPQRIESRIANDPRDRRRVRVCIDPREIKRLAAQPALTEALTSDEVVEPFLVVLLQTDEPTP